jgi:tetratricopeptide (TPR) repeat protein
MYEDALRIARDLGNQAAIATVLLDLGQVLGESSEPNSARARFEEALGIARAIGDINLTEETLVNLGSLASRSMDLEGANKAFDEALAIARAHGHHRVIGAVLVDTSNIQERIGELDKAVALGREGVAEARKANEPAILNSALTALAEHLSEQGDFDGALATFDEIEKLQTDAGDKIGLVNTNVTRVGVLAVANRDVEAKKLALATLALIDSKSDPGNYGWLKLALAKREAEAGHFDAADPLIEAAASVVINAGDASLASEVRIVKAEILAGRRKLDQAHAALAKLRAENRDDESLLLEIEIVGATIDWAYGHDLAARARLGELAKKARARGAGTMARQAEHEMKTKH